MRPCSHRGIATIARAPDCCLSAQSTNDGMGCGVRYYKWTHLGRVLIKLAHPTSAVVLEILRRPGTDAFLLIGLNSLDGAQVPSPQTCHCLTSSKPKHQSAVQL
jgi:hypothetical protein